MWRFLLSAFPLVVLTQAEFLGKHKEGGSHELYIGDNIHFQSRNLGKAYPKNTDDVFDLTCLNYTGSIVADCPNVDILRSAGCKNDNLSFNDGNSIIDDAYCGKRSIQIISGDNTLKTTFHSGNARKGRVTGFYCKFSCVEVADKKTTVAGQTTTTRPTTTAPTQAPTSPLTTVRAFERCQCGLPNAEGATKKYPWVASITEGKSTAPIAGVSMLTDKHFLTACDALSNDINSLRVSVGEYDWTKLSDNIEFERYNIKEVYDNGDGLCIIEINRSVNLNEDELNPVCLPKKGESYVSKTGIVSSYTLGLSGDDLHPTPDDNNFMISDDCSSPNELCDNSDVKMGPKDAGSPLMVDNGNGHVVQVGVAKATGNEFLKIDDAALDFIDNTITNAKSCGKTVSAETEATTAPTAPTAPTTPAPVPTTAAPGFDCTCGTKALTSNPIEKAPWTIALVDKTTGLAFCSGTLINTYYILTSKSCTSKTSVSNIQVQVNVDNISTGSPSVVKRFVVSSLSNGPLTLLKVDTPLSPISRIGTGNLCLNMKAPSSSNAASSGFSNSGNLVISDGASQGTSFTPSSTPSDIGAIVGGPVFSSETLDGTSVDALVGIIENNSSASSQGFTAVDSYLQWILDNTSTGRFCKKWIIS